MEIDFLAGTPLAGQTAKRPAWALPADTHEDAVGGLALTPAIEREVFEPDDTRDGVSGGLAVAYDRETRDAVVDLVIIKGQSIVSVCRETGIGERTVQGWLTEYRQMREIQSEATDLRQIDLIETAGDELLRGLTKAKVDKAGVRDIGIAYGILRDKLKDIRGPRSGGGNLHLRAVFRGEGAIEVHTGGSE